jgi:hypothetical protein
MHKLREWFKHMICPESDEVRWLREGKFLLRPEVKRRVESYQSPEVTSALYSLGSFLVNANVDLAHQLDSKASTLAAYAGAILSILISTFKIWGQDIETKEPAHWSLWFVLLGGFLIAGAAALALFGLSVTRFQWFSDNDWFREPVLNNADSLKRYHVMVMHETNYTHRNANTKKAERLEWAQKSFGVGTLFLLAALADAIYRLHAK